MKSSGTLLIQVQCTTISLPVTYRKNKALIIRQVIEGRKEGREGGRDGRKEGREEGRKERKKNIT